MPNQLKVLVLLIERINNDPTLLRRRAHTYSRLQQDIVEGSKQWSYCWYATVHLHNYLVKITKSPRDFL